MGTSVKGRFACVISRIFASTALSTSAVSFSPRTVTYTPLPSEFSHRTRACGYSVSNASSITKRSERSYTRRPSSSR